MNDEKQIIDEVVPETPPEEVAGESESRFSYTNYVALGGRINRGDYARVMERAQEESNATSGEGFSKNQTRTTAEISGVDLDAVRDEFGIDPRCVYGILRYDELPPLAIPQYHHGAMSDQALLVESLRMIGAVEAVNAIVEKHPHISFS